MRDVQSDRRRIVHLVRRIELGSPTSYRDGLLTVDPSEASAVLAAPALLRASVAVAAPGEATRIVKVLDVVEPRANEPGDRSVFPGFLAAAGLAGPGGATHVLRGAAVVAAGYLPRAQEAVLDMSGPAAALTPFGATHNLVIEFEPVPGADWAEVDAAVRLGALRLAAMLAKAALGAPPDAIEGLRAAAVGSQGLPRVGAITNLQTQGVFKDVFVYGRSMAGGLPTILDDAELDDGAVVSGQYGHPALRNPTYVHQNHPVVAALRARDGVDLRFGGVILSPEPVEDAAKRLVAEHAARLCAACGFDAVVITKEGGGNADADVSLKMDALDALGIVAVGLFGEMAGPDGTAPSVVFPPSREGGMVSTGNYDERLSLPAMSRALGGERIDLLDAAATDAVEVPVAVLPAALSPLGATRLRCEEAA